MEYICNRISGESKETCLHIDVMPPNAIKDQFKHIGKHIYTFRCTDIFQHNYLPVFDCPYFRLIASVEMTHCLPYLQASTPLTSLPYRRLQSGTILSVQRSL